MEAPRLPKRGPREFDPRTTERPRAVGKGREGVNPFPGTGNWGFMKDLHAMRPKGLGGFVT